MGKGNHKNEEKKEGKKEKEVLLTSFNFSFPEIAKNEDEAKKSVLANLNSISLNRL